MSPPHDNAEPTQRREPSCAMDETIPLDGACSRIQSGLQRIGRYSIERVIASGGMGTVYAAKQDQPSRTVAVKVMQNGLTSAAALRRFEFESQLLARLQHPGIAQVFEAGTQDTGSGMVPFFAMEYVPEAKPITRYARDRGLKTGARLELFLQVCDAVHYGHQQGVIHRDLKPGNILVDAGGRVKIIDFGVARSTDSDLAVTTMHTAVGDIVGTLQYMSPEQCAADPNRIDIRSDVYSLGVVLYELLGEQLPYNLSNLPLFEATRVIREDPPTRLSTVDRALRGDLETITAKALEKERERRYPSALCLAEDITRYLRHEPIVARPPSLTYVFGKFVRKRRFPLAAAALLLLALGIAAYFRIQASRAALTVAAATAQKLLLQAQLESQRDPDKALRKYDEAIAVSPDHVEAKLEKAFLLRHLSRFPLAIAAAQEIINDNPSHAGPAHLLLAQLYRDREPAKAALHQQEGARLLPDDKYYRALALDTDHAEEAIRLLTAVVVNDVLNYGALWARALRYHDLGNWEAMLADTERLTLRWPERGTYWNGKGLALARLGLWREAIASYSEFLKRVPDNGLVYLNRAETYLKLGEPDKALADCNKSIELEPKIAAAFALRARVRARNEEFDAAWKDARRALDLDPANSLALRTAGYLHVLRHEFEPAREAYKKGMASGEGQPEDFHNRARLYRLAGDFASALSDHDRAIDKEPGVSTYYQGRGITRRCVGDIDGALADFSYSTSKKPVATVQSNQWIWETRMLRGADGDRAEADAALERALQAAANPFEIKMIDVCLGRVAVAEAARAAQDQDERCAAFYYAGARALVDGRYDDARSLFERARDAGAHNQPEYDLAIWHLTKLANR